MAALDKELAACVEPVVTKPVDIKVPVTFSVGPDGHVLRADGHWPATLPAATRSCLATALRHTWFNCPLSGHAAVTARLELLVR